MVSFFALKQTLMGKTRRKDKEGNVFFDGRPTKAINHRCRCEECTGVSKNNRLSTILNKELTKELKGEL